VRRFQKLMGRLAVGMVLKDAGVQEGETVYIGEH
jgi:hypothetical protein